MVNRIKIGFDAKRYFYNQTGLGNYARLLIKGVVADNANFESLLFTPKKPSDSFLPKAKIITPYGLINRLFPSLWRSKYMVKDLSKYGLHIFHGTSNELPFNIHQIPHLKTVVTIHDVINLIYPENYKKIDRWVYRQKLEYAVKYADAIVVVSESTKKDLLKFFEVDEKKIHVIGLSKAPYTEISDPSLVPDVPYMLCVSSLGKRKNIPNLIKAHSQLDNPPKLIIAGGKGDDEAQVILAKNENKNCEILLNPTDAHLQSLYKNCLFTVYPSVYEGFGIPILEAFQHGKVVATSNISSMPEVGGNAAEYFNPLDLDSITNALSFLLIPENRKKLAVYIPNQLAQFESQHLLQAYKEVYQKVLNLEK
jgi:glycosyltransferase involved in cell wall biosynthesis